MIGFIIFVLFLLLLVQYAGVASCFIEDDITTKEQLKYWLIPFAPVHYIYKITLEKYKELK